MSFDGCGTRVTPFDDSFGLTCDASLRSARARGLLSESANSMGSNNTLSAYQDRHKAVWKLECPRQ